MRKCKQVRLIVDEPIASVAAVGAHHHRRTSCDVERLMEFLVPIIAIVRFDRGGNTNDHVDGKVTPIAEVELFHRIRFPTEKVEIYRSSTMRKDML